MSVTLKSILNAESSLVDKEDIAAIVGKSLVGVTATLKFTSLLYWLSLNVI